jgi:hypothetical protein
MGIGRRSVYFGGVVRDLLLSALAWATAFSAPFLVLRELAIRYEMKMTGYSIARDALPAEFGFGLRLLGALAVSAFIALLAGGFTWHVMRRHQTQSHLPMSRYTDP